MGSWLLAVMTATCLSFAGKRVPSPEFVPPTTNVHLRAAFDTDPRPYLGRFVFIDADRLDESSARVTSCSRFAVPTEVGGGHVQYDEVFESSSKAALSLGVPSTDLTFGGSGGQSTSLRAEYSLTRKLVGNVVDPVGLNACCRQNPGECTDRMIGEFLEGTGSIWVAKSSSADIKVLEQLKALGLDAEAHHGAAWARARTFPEPVYFAFRIVELPPFDCASVVATPPQTPDRVYFGAVSDWFASEQLARDDAYASAREQAVRYLGESIAARETSTRHTTGVAGAPVVHLDGQSKVERVTEGVARFVKDECTSVEQSPSVDGPRYKVRMLAYMPREAVEEATKALAE